MPWKQKGFAKTAEKRPFGPQSLPEARNAPPARPPARPFGPRFAPVAGFTPFQPTPRRPLRRCAAALRWTRGTGSRAGPPALDRSLRRFAAALPSAARAGRRARPLALTPLACGSAWPAPHVGRSTGPRMRSLWGERHPWRGRAASCRPGGCAPYYPPGGSHLHHGGARRTFRIRRILRAPRYNWGMEIRKHIRAASPEAKPVCAVNGHSSRGLTVVERYLQDPVNRRRYERERRAMEREDARERPRSSG